MTWTAEATDLLRARVAEGRPASQIACDLRGLLPGISRNAVIGKCLRLGIKLAGKTIFLPSNESSATPAEGVVLPPTKPVERFGKGRPSRIISVAPKKRVKPPIRRDLPAPDSPWVPLSKLRLGDCRFPKGHPGDDDFAYCGAPAPDRPYCPYHRGIAFESASDRKKARKMQCQATV